jgi:hypothetical protein
MASGADEMETREGRGPVSVVMETEEGREAVIVW